MWPFTGIIAIAGIMFGATMMAARLWWLDHRDD